MKRDMDLLRKILIAIENKYKPGDGPVSQLAIDGYDLKTIAEHCDLLYQEGLVKDYKPLYGDNTIQAFWVGNLTNKGYDYLELVRDDGIYNKTKTEVKNKKLPETIEWFAKIAGIFTGEVIKGLND